MKYKIEWENTEAPDLPEDQQRQLEKDIEYMKSTLGRIEAIVTRRD